MWRVVEYGARSLSWCRSGSPDPPPASTFSWVHRDGISSQADMCIRFFDHNFDCVARYHIDKSHMSLRWHGFSGTLFSGSRDGCIHQWEVPAVQEYRVLPSDKPLEPIVWRGCDPKKCPHEPKKCPLEPKCSYDPKKCPHEPKRYCCICCCIFGKSCSCPTVFQNMLYAVRALVAQRSGLQVQAHKNIKGSGQRGICEFAKRANFAILVIFANFCEFLHFGDFFLRIFAKFAKFCEFGEF